jgi:hypothetical protein
MIVYLQIAATFDFQIEQAVAREQVEHVIQKRHARRDARLPASVQIQGDAHLRLLRLPLNLPGACSCLKLGAHKKSFSR